MKRIAILFVLALWLTPIFSAQATQMCFKDRRIASVKLGNVVDSQGADGGYAVYFRLDNVNSKPIPLNNTYNLNDTGRGPALYKALMTAMAGGFRVIGYDHYYPYCDDIDEIEIYR